MPRREDYCLRRVTEQDIEKILKWRNSDAVCNNMFTDHVITMEEHRKWFERLEGEKYPLAMLFEAYGKPVGIVSISQIEEKNNKCHWGFYIGDVDVPKGTGTIMGYFGLEMIFEKLQIRKLIGEAFAFNKASVNYHKKLGFKQEGWFARHILKNGKYEDVVVFALFKEDWPMIKQKLELMLFDGIENG